MRKFFILYYEGFNHRFNVCAHKCVCVMGTWLVCGSKAKMASVILDGNHKHIGVDDVLLKDKEIA